MLRAIIRFIGFWLLAAATIGIVADGARSIAAAEILFIPAGDIWAWVSAPSLETARETLQRNGLSLLWEPVLVTILKAPASLLGLGLAVLLLWAAQRRSHRDGLDLR